MVYDELAAVFKSTQESIFILLHAIQVTLFDQKILLKMGLTENFWLVED